VNAPSSPTPDRLDAVMLKPSDNVATALRAIAANETVRVGTPEGVREIIAAELIPLCHKLALEALPAGTVVRKFAAPIGWLEAAVAAGGLVHVHNMRSLRGQRAGEAGAESAG